ncbi:MAG: hypothetical protein WD068_01550 [Candidatus Babeliales bacterium]
MKRLLLILIPTIHSHATGNLMIQNTDFGSPPIIAVIEGIGSSDKCFLILPGADSDSFDTAYQRINGWVRLYHSTQFHNNIKEALRKCNLRDYLQKTPIYETNIQLGPNTPNIMIEYQEDGTVKNPDRQAVFNFVSY